nr:unnamed protein product [Callosobruchus analis]
MLFKDDKQLNRDGGQEIVLQFITINKAPTESPDPEEPKPGPSHEKLLDSDVEEHPVQKKNKTL